MSITIDVVAEECVQKGAPRRMVKDSGDWCNLGNYDLKCPCLNHNSALVVEGEKPRIYYNCRYREDPLFAVNERMEPRGWRG